MAKGPTPNRSAGSLETFLQVETQSKHQDRMKFAALATPPKKFDSALADTTVLGLHHREAHDSRIITA
jgi:hypothetical protein